MKCSGLGLTQLPSQLPSYMTKLDISNNQFRTIPSQLSRYQIEELNISGNQIEFTDDLFDGFGRHLEKLKMDDNDIKTLPHFGLSGLFKLKELSLRNNLISCISNESFIQSEMTNLERLDLYDNQINEIGEGKGQYRIYIW